MSERLASVDAIRAHQRDWLAESRRRAADGEPFVVCTSDEFEEPLNALGVPVLVINYWNFVVTSQGKKAHFTRVLNRRGFPGEHFFGLGFATALEPEEAPWGGLPRPAVVLGSTRHDYEIRVAELWARHEGVPCLPMDFNFNAPLKRTPPDDWWARIRFGWRDLVDPAQLHLRKRENAAMIAELEARLDRTIPTGGLEQTMRTLNRQMDVMDATTQLIAEADRSPVTFRDQLAAYQTMWHRGTELGLQLAQDYHDEVAHRVARGVAAYPEERKRVVFWTTQSEPAFHSYLRERHGVVIVGSAYSEMPAVYARDVESGVEEALAARHLFLFDFRSTSWIIHSARRHRADAIIAVERSTEHSAIAAACEEAGIPYLGVAGPADDPATREAIDAFVSRL